MKKILMNAAIATGLALFAGNAFAADPDAFATSIGFEQLDPGPLNILEDDAGGNSGTLYWVQGGDAESTVVTAYGESFDKPDSRPDKFAGETNNNFLKIDSPNGLSRYIPEERTSQSLESDVFVDMNVQFTVSDTVLDLGANTDNDKLAIWLYAPDTEGAETNLVITAATVDGNGKPTAKNFVATLENPVVPDKWYRLTVKAVGAVAPKGPCFNVYVDGEKVSSSATVEEETFETAVSDFYSLVKYAVSEPTTTTLSSVTFQGVGALDDLTFTTKTPSFFPVEVAPFAIGETGYDTFADAVEEAGGEDVITMQANYDASNEIGETLTVEGNVTLDIGTFTLSGEYPITVAGGNLTLLGSGTVSATENAILINGSGSVTLGDSDGVPTLASIIVDAETYSIKRYGAPEANAIEVVDGESGDAITGTWVAEAGETGYYVFTPGGEEPAGDLDPAAGTIEVTVEAGTAEAAVTDAKAAIKVPAAAAEAVTANAYAEYFTYSTVDNGNGTFTVAIEGIVEEIEEAVLESAVERLTDDEATTIAVPAGLYYSITPSTALPISGEAVKGLSTGGTVSVGKPGTTAGFYEIKLSPTEIK